MTNERTTASPIPQVHHRLDHDQYLALAKQCDRPFVSEVTTPLQAGYQLGVQAVLKLLREGWVTQ